MVYRDHVCFRRVSASVLALAFAYSGASCADAQDATPTSAGAVKPATSTPSIDPVSTTPTALASTAGNHSNEIVVTGSRIARSRDYVASSPIATVNAAALQSSGQSTIGEALNQLPQLSAGASSTSPSGSAAGGAATDSGRTLADLRGLGSPRTLVLIDGGRVQPSDSFNRVDLSIIPTALIDNVEIITGGASAIYGSDALAGVINLKLKQHFQGFRVDGQFGGTTDGGGHNYTVAGTMGTNFKDDRGNIVLSIEHQKRNIISYADRPYQYLNSNIFVGSTTGQVYMFPPGNASQSAIDQVFSKYGVTPGTVTTRSSFGINNDGTVFAEGPGGGGGANMKTNPTDALYVKDGTVQSRTSSSAYVQTPMSKYTLFARGSYDITDHIQAYTQGFFSTYKTRVSGRSVPIVFIPITNPFVPTDLATLAASRADPTAPLYYNSVSSVMPLITSDKATVWQIVAGLRGKIGIGDWTYDVSGTTGRSTTDETVSGLPNAAAFDTLLSAADGGRSICAGGLNLFPFVSISNDCKAKAFQSGYSRTEVRQQAVDLSIQGGLLHWWGGDIRFAAGFDYRKNSYSFQPDSYLQPDPVTGLALFNSYNYPTVSPAAGSNSVKEGFLELSVPLVSHKPLAEELSLDAAYRYSDYRVGGSANSYTFEAVWAPFQILRFRGGYQHSIRAPSPGEAYSAAVAGTSDIGSVTGGGGDPCSSDYVGRRPGAANAAQLRQLCIATGVPAGLVDTYTTAQTGVLTHTSGNPALKPEVGDSFTAGVVLTSPVRSVWLEGLSVSLDYYNIKVTGAIGSVTGQYALNACYNIGGVGGGNASYSPQNQYCQAINRINGAQPGAVNYIDTPLMNLGAYRVSGLDLSVNWSLNLTEFTDRDIGKLNLSSIISYVDKYAIQNTSDSPSIDYVGTIGNNQISGYSHPRWKTNTTLTYSLKKAQVGARWRYISGMKNALDLTTSTVNPSTPAFSYFDIFGSYGLTKDITIQVGMNNIANRKPPYFSQTSPSTDPSTYDVIGRAFYLRAGVQF